MAAIGGGNGGSVKWRRSVNLAWRRGGINIIGVKRGNISVMYGEEKYRGIMAAGGNNGGVASYRRRGIGVSGAMWRGGVTAMAASASAAASGWQSGGGAAQALSVMASAAAAAYVSVMAAAAAA